MREEHHIIPRAYGGVDGPTVSLCEHHHATLHKMAVAMKANKPYFQLTANHTPLQLRKLNYLATRVFEAEQLTRNDPNKRNMLMLSLTPDRVKKIEDLKRVLPAARSREAVLFAALDALHSRFFMD